MLRQYFIRHHKHDAARRLKLSQTGYAHFVVENAFLQSDSAFNCFCDLECVCTEQVCQCQQKFDANRSKRDPTRLVESAAGRMDRHQQVSHLETKLPRSETDVNGKVRVVSKLSSKRFFSMINLTDLLTCSLLQKYARTRPNGSNYSNRPCTAIQGKCAAANAFKIHPSLWILFDETNRRRTGISASRQSEQFESFAEQPTANFPAAAKLLFREQSTETVELTARSVGNGFVSARRNWEDGF